MKFVRLLLVALLLTLTSGCIKFSETLTLNNDGSGLLDIEYTIPEETVTQLSGMMALADELAQATGEAPPSADHDYLTLLLNPSEDRITRQLENDAIDGLTLKSVKVDSGNGRRHVKLQVAFDRLSHLAETDYFTQHGFVLTRTAEGNYRLERKGSSAPSRSPVDVEDPQVIRRLTPILGGFQATVGVKTPGRILQANTTRRSLRQAVWQFDFNRDAADFRSFYTKDLVVVFDGAGLSLPAE